jgi:cysteine desulfurase
LNVPGIVGLGRACELCQLEGEAEAARLTGLRERLFEGIAAQVPGVVRNGHPRERLPGNLHLSFPGIDGAALLLALRELALSSGSACSAGSSEPSHVLRAIGVPDELAQSSLRFGLGRANTAEEIEYAIVRVAEEVERLRAAAPVLPPALAPL